MAHSSFCNCIQIMHCTRRNKQQLTTISIQNNNVNNNVINAQQIDFSPSPVSSPDQGGKSPAFLYGNALSKESRVRQTIPQPQPLANTASVRRLVEEKEKTFAGKP